MFLWLLELSEYYFDIETTGRNLESDEILTIQWQGLGFRGEPNTELTILKSWESSEKEILKTFLPMLKAKGFSVILVGENLLFDLSFLSQRLKHHSLFKLDFPFLYNKPFIDLKPLLILINRGFKGYNKLIPKTNPIANYQIPQFYKEGKFAEIIQYIRDEANDFTKAYQIPAMTPA